MTPTIELLDNQGSTSTSETVDNSKSITKTSDLRKMSHKSYEKQFPQFYYSATEDGLYCKICSSFSDIRITDQAFVNKVSIFGDHPTCRSKKHLSLTRHQESLQNKQAYDELLKKNPTCGNFYKNLLYYKQWLFMFHLNIMERSPSNTLEFYR